MKANRKWLICSAALGMIGITAAVSWLAAGYGGWALVPAIGLGLVAALGGGWLFRARAARRFLAAMDGYAERQLAASHRRPTHRTRVPRHCRALLLRPG